jgi:hypothetical protein
VQSSCERAAHCGKRAELAASDQARLRRALLDAEVELQRISTKSLHHESAHKVVAAELEHSQLEFQRLATVHERVSRDHPQLQALLAESQSKVRLLPCLRAFRLHMVAYPW